MQKTQRIKLWVILTLLFSATAIRSQEIPTTLSAVALSSNATQVVSTGERRTPLSATDDCADQLAAEKARVLKLLDAYDKANAVIAAQANEIKALKDLDITRKAQIEARDELLEFYQKQNRKGKWRQALEKIEKYGTLAAGIWIGTKL